MDRGEKRKMDFETIGAGAGSGVVGVILAFFGFKSRLDNMEKKVCGKVDKGVCVAIEKSVDDKFDAQMDLLRETRTDVKSILERL